jgi:hypothetical protein
MKGFGGAGGLVGLAVIGDGDVGVGDGVGVGFGMVG